MDTNKSQRQKTNKAVGLSYEIGETAPKVVAKGIGFVADRLIEKASEEKIHTYKDEDLVDALMDLEINEEIPQELYDAVAEIIFYVYSLDIEKGK
ncbi:MAG: EscU/YscU/HrcU family type III secretion system export apparatus switch protein [Tissierellaceae bacterium]|nr:EscU/YscU/HrcU family type III secretion system export apparatus switch protein [Tissierellaceae bacterium]